MKQILIAASIALLASTTALARQAPLVEPPRVALSTQTAEQVRGYIVNGARTLGWTVVSEKDGQVTLKFNKQNKHEVVINADYDAKGYQLRYVSSSNMNFEEANGQREIHPNYNRWINNLIKRIGEAQTMAQ
ncbi:hypothetical protein [Chitinimonas lacunae]|uniref:Lipoprotein n=1 Tax=Chitinimonas lacunae TaxID=1963018 RepID=A0ABV8MQK6_9NEIS